MKLTKIKIKNLFGIEETELDGRSVEIIGRKGAGKSSFIDSIRYGFTNASDRDFIVKKGEKEGQIFIETDTGVSIDRKKRTDSSDYKAIKDNHKNIPSPQEFLNNLFSPLQLNPIEFINMSKQEQNRTILDLIEYDWDLNTIKEWFGEIPQNVDYSQNILQVLNDIQSEKGTYFITRQDINREIRDKHAMISDISSDIPEHYDAEFWKNYQLGEKFKELERLRLQNSQIEKAKQFKQSYDNKVKGLQAEKQIKISAIDKEISSEREALNKQIERMKAEIKACEDKLSSLNSVRDDKVKLAETEFTAQANELSANLTEYSELAEQDITDLTELSAEITNAESMKQHLNEYNRMTAYQIECEQLSENSKALTDKIQLARDLPGKILQTATIPVEGLTVVDGIPLIHGLPVSNLSDGEKLDLCVDIAISNPNSLQLILIDGMERFDDESRQKLYDKCKAKGLQFIATRTTNGELGAVYFD